MTKLAGNQNRKMRTQRGMCGHTIGPLVALLVLSIGASSVSALKVNMHGGYEDLVIKVDDDVPPIICQQLLQNLRDAFSSSSDYLHEATNGLVYFHRILVVLPSRWDSRACGGQLPSHFTSGSTAAEASYVVRGDHPIFGSAPFTQQSQGCGKPGDLISVGYRFFLPNNDTSDGTSPYPHRTLVHEWTKYRYGVFEEVGFANDSIYPLGFMRDSKSDVEPNLCTNGKISGTWSKDCADAAGGNCAFQVFPDSNVNITSSILSVPNLPQVQHFCESSSHNEVAPSKQNFLCNGKSVSEVMLSHSDFRNRSFIRPPGRTTPEFIVKRIAPPRYVLLIEETANMNLRDVWKYLKLAVRKFIKYDLERGTQVGIITMGTDNVRVLANMTTLDETVRGTLAEKLPNYPNIESTGSLSLRRGISQAINMLKWNGARVAGSVIILISQGMISKIDQEGSVRLLQQEEVSVATIEYPSSGDGKVASLALETKSPFYYVRETGVGTMSHMSTYIQLINALTSIQQHFSLVTTNKTPMVVHQEEFSGDAPSFVESSFTFDGTRSPGQFYIYVPNPIDPKVNIVELMSPSGKKYTDQLSLLHDINVIKIDANIDQPGVWHYRIQRLGDSHQSHFVQVVTTGSWNQEFLSVRVFSNADGPSRLSDSSSQQPLILYADVKKGVSPVLGAEVEAFINSGGTKWSVKLLDTGSGDPDITRGDGVYSRYILPPLTARGYTLDIAVKVSTTPYQSKYVGWNAQEIVKYRNEPCCGSSLVSIESDSLKSMPYNERLVTSYSVKFSSTVNTSKGYPPARVGDLRVFHTLDRNITFQFTCPGDDFDQGKVQSFEFYVSKSRNETSFFILEKFPAAETSLAGMVVNVTLAVQAYGRFFFKMVSVDPLGNPSPFSNVVQLNLQRSGLGTGSSDLQSQESNSRQAVGSQLSKSEIAFTVVGALASFVLVVGVVILCLCCRRKKSNKDVNETEAKVYAITQVKEPIHYSASQLLQAHEKRLSMYGQTSRSENMNGNNSSQPPRQLQQQRMQHDRNYSPASSTRSFRSFVDGHYRVSIDGGRRPTFTDYDSCSSDPIVKGNTEYDTAVDSDTDNLHYRTIDSYVGAMYRANLSANVNPAFGETPPVSSSGGPTSTTTTVRYNEPTQVQYNYNSSFQGSTSSVNSKRRNITMV